MSAFGILLASMRAEAQDTAKASPSTGTCGSLIQAGANCIDRGLNYAFSGTQTHGSLHRNDA